MKKLTQHELDEMIILHEKWSNDDADGIQADFSNMDLSGLNFTAKFLRHIDFHGANLTSANFNHVDLGWAYLINANLTDANLSWADLVNVDLSGANLTNAFCNNSAFILAELVGCDLTSANFTEAYIYSVDFTDAIFKDTDFTHANIRDSMFPEKVAAEMENVIIYTDSEWKQIQKCLENKAIFRNAWKAPKYPEVGKHINIPKINMEDLI